MRFVVALVLVFVPPPTSGSARASIAGLASSRGEAAK